eukprot:c7815_g1_i2.p1 GENE.c7815_g1_i2~~c7815_g1_i2.p1  ORF type:complete len:221 (+),score=46.45 c7815_g1_i2:1-663(+)
MGAIPTNNIMLRARAFVGCHQVGASCSVIRAPATLMTRNASIAKYFETAAANDNKTSMFATLGKGTFYEPYGSFDAQRKKISTNLVGIDVVPDARERLIRQAQEILRCIALDIPPTAQYRINVERTFRFRLRIAQEVEDIYELEQTIRCGQVEELLRQGESELKLISKMREWRPWEASEESIKELEQEAESLRQTLIRRNCEFTEYFLDKSPHTHVPLTK